MVPLRGPTNKSYVQFKSNAHQRHYQTRQQKGVNMLKKQLKYIALPIILICSGCDEYIDLKLNTKDIESVVASGNSSAATANIRITGTNCESNKEKMTKLLSPFFGDLKETRCDNKDAYLATVNIPIAPVKSENLIENSSSGMTFQVNHDKEWVEVFLVINHDKLSLLNENMKSEFKSSEDLKRENLHMSFDITNNGRENYSLNAEGVYLNGKPNSIGFTERVPFDRTKSNKISLSNVVLDNILNTSDGSYAAARIATLFNQKSK